MALDVPAEGVVRITVCYTDQTRTTPHDTRDRGPEYVPTLLWSSTAVDWLVDLLPSALLLSPPHAVCLLNTLGWR
jgi:hypothetical protein